ncbi:MAG: AAA family ATPase [Phycisphaerales bacterium]|nr:AAA family ATPase [Phycisphaerales bacterium]
MSAQTPAPVADLPPWAAELIALYQSETASQFILYGNVADRLVIPQDGGQAMGELSDFLLRVLLPRFDVVLSFDVGNGIRVEKGNEIFSQWPALKEMPGGSLPRTPRAAVEALTIFFRYLTNLSRLQKKRYHVACIVKNASLIAPAVQGSLNYDLAALASLIRDWSSDSTLTEHSLATFLITENLNDLHPLLANNTRAAQIRIPLPPPEAIGRAIQLLSKDYPTALSQFAQQTDHLAGQLAGASLSAVEAMLKTSEYRRKPISPGDVVSMKKQLVEKDCNGLIEFIESRRSLDDLHGQEAVKRWLRQDFALWRKNDLAALPMGYLLCGPVGTGKTFMVESLAGDAGVPVVKIKNFRDKWVGSTEGNLERIFRLLAALGRCFVFVDEADQALGKRDAGSGDSGLSGRVYGMFAEMMSNTANRGKIVWILASSRPDLIEVDLKRPGRIDVKIPLLPTSSPEEGFGLLRALCRRKGVEIAPEDFEQIRSLIPPLLTPGAAETLAVKVYRTVRTSDPPLPPIEALRQCLTDYQSPVPAEVMEFQIDIALREASDIDFVPPAFRNRLNRIA